MHDLISNIPMLVHNFHPCNKDMAVTALMKLTTIRHQASIGQQFWPLQIRHDTNWNDNNLTSRYRWSTTLTTAIETWHSWNWQQTDIKLPLVHSSDACDWDMALMKLTTIWHQATVSPQLWPLRLRHGTNEIDYNLTLSYRWSTTLTTVIETRH